jgi:O-antigen/teichoic acid export membrane protein
LDFFQYFIGKEFRAGLAVVPILLLANLCLGVYVNLSIWYKLTDRTGLGALVSLLGAVLTIALNIYWIPLFGYRGSAYATLICYATMAVLSYFLGQHYYPVAYNVRRILLTIGLGLSLYLVREPLQNLLLWQPWLLSAALLSLYVLIAALLGQRDLHRRQNCS